MVSGELLLVVFSLSDQCISIGTIRMVCNAWHGLANAECLERQFGLAIQLRKYALHMATPTTFSSRHTAAVNTLALGPGSVVASGSDDKTIVLGALQQPGICLVSPDYDHGFSSEVYALAFNNTGAVLYSGSSDSYAVQQWETCSGKLTKILEGHSGYVSALAITSNNILFSGSADHDIRRWSSPLRFPHFHSTAVTSLVIAAESSQR